MNWDNYKAIAKFDKSGVSWVGLPPKSMVYSICFGNDTYIGSTKNIKNRIGLHFRELSDNRHYSAKMQDAFNSSVSFLVYCIEEVAEGNIKKREQVHINKIRPTLNKKRCFSLEEKNYQYVFEEFLRHEKGVSFWKARRSMGDSGKDLKKAICVIRMFSETIGVPMSEMFNGIEQYEKSSKRI